MSAEHLGALGATVAAAGWAAARPRSAVAARALALVIGVAYAAEQAEFVVRGTWALDFNLPLHLSDAVTIVAVVALWSGRPLAAELTYFWALTASLQAVLTPDLGSTEFPELLYWTYFITHSGAVVAALLLVRRALVPRPGAVPRIFALTAAFAALAGLANVVTGGNYMWLREKPDMPSLLDVMGPWPWYIVSGAVLGLLLFYLLDLPFRRPRTRTSQA